MAEEVDLSSLSIGNVKLVPFTVLGTVYLGLHEISWSSDDAKEVVVIPIDDISKVLGDDASDTLVLTRRRDGAIYLFNNLSDQASALMNRIQETQVEVNSTDSRPSTPIPEAEDASWWNTQDIGTTVLDSFARVTHFYGHTAKRLLGLAQTKRPERDPSDGPVLNPWIQRKVSQ